MHRTLDVGQHPNYIYAPTHINIRIIWAMGVPPFYGKGPQPLLWAASWATHGKLTISGIPDRLNSYITFILYP